MEHTLHILMEYLRHHPILGILFTFIIAFIESLPVLGTLFPGSVTMTAIGALIGASILPPVFTGLSAILGAFLGDCLGFWLGCHYREKIRTVWPFRKLTRWLTYSEKFFIKHGGKSLVIGRFIGPTRAAMPLIAGLLQMTRPRFLRAAITAAVLWSVIYMLPGVVLGALALEFPPAQVTTVLVMGSLYIIAVWLVFWVIQFFFKQLTRFIARRIQSLWLWLNRKQPCAAHWISNHQNPEDYQQLTLILLFLLSGIFFLSLWFSVIHHSGWTEINRPLFYFIQSFRAFAYRLWLLLTLLATPETLLVTAMLTAAVFAWRKQWRASVHLAILAVLSTGAIKFVKAAVFSARPAGFFYVDPSSSFPSGHTVMSTAIFGFLVFLAGKIVARAWRRMIYTGYFLLILLIGLSRVFLGQHWLTDILGGWLLGFCLLLFIIISYRRMPKSTAEFNLTKKSGLTIIALGILIPWAGAVFFDFQATKRDTQPIWPSITLNQEKWWSEPMQNVPLYRLDRFGRIAQPFNVQWAGRLEDIRTLLESRGWQASERLSRLNTTLKRFSSYEPEDNRQLLPPLYQNHPPALFFIKHLKDSHDILELRLWRSGVRFADSDMPLWIGIITYHTPPEKILRFPHHYVHLPSASGKDQRLLFFGPNAEHFEFQWVHIPTEQQPESIRALDWNGDIFILRMG